MITTNQSVNSLKSGLKIKLAALIVMTLVVIFVASAPAAHAASNFWIEDFNVDVVVDEDDTYRVTEKLTVDFTQPSHGIYRTIPYMTTLDRDGKQTKFRAGIDDFKMLSSQKYKDQSDANNFNIRFGDADKYEKDRTVYKYSYTYDMKGDHLEDADEFYYNFVGTTWEAQSIDRVTFKVHFPKKVDPEKIGVKAGTTDVHFNIDESGKVVSGTTTEYVMSGLTMRAYLPQGYFTKQAGSNSLLYYIMLVALFFLTIGGMIMWSRNGRDKKMVRTVEFESPEGLPSEVIGYLFYEEAKGEGVLSILLELAHKGYVKIVETKKKSYKIVCLKEYDGDSEYEREFMDGLFKNYSRKEVTKAGLKNHFYKTVESIKKAIAEDYKEKLYDEKADSISSILMLIGFISFALLFIGTRLLNGFPLFKGDFTFNLAMMVLAPLLTGAGFSTLFSFVNKKKASRIFGGLGLIAGGILCAFIYESFPLERNMFYMAGFIMSAVVFLLSKICEKKTDWYVDTLGKIYGYRDFLKKAEKDRIEKLVEQDPDYFYRNLAYAYALDVTNAYARQFEGMLKEPPTWYESSTRMTPGGMMNAMVMESMLHDMMHAMDSAMTSSPSSGGSGGGSFSGGGGAGGGGGGSW